MNNETDAEKLVQILQHRTQIHSRILIDDFNFSPREIIIISP
jgi:hypothetical protein